MRANSEKSSLALSSGATARRGYRQAQVIARERAITSEAAAGTGLTIFEYGIQ